MYKIVLAKQRHLEMLLKCFRRVDEIHPGCKDEVYLANALNENEVYIMLEQQRVYAYAIVTTNLKDGLFPTGDNKNRRLYSLLDEISVDDENLLLVQGFGIDPAIEFWPNAKSIFDYLFSLFDKPTMLIRLEDRPSKEKEDFLLRLGAKKTYPQTAVDGQLLVKKNEATGLARGFAW